MIPLRHRFSYLKEVACGEGTLYSSVFKKWDDMPIEEEFPPHEIIGFERLPMFCWLKAEMSADADLFKVTEFKYQPGDWGREPSLVSRVVDNSATLEDVEAHVLDYQRKWWAAGFTQLDDPEQPFALRMVPPLEPSPLLGELETDLSF